MRCRLLIIGLPLCTAGAMTPTSNASAQEAKPSPPATEDTGAESGQRQIDEPDAEVDENSEETAAAGAELDALPPVPSFDVLAAVHEETYEFPDVPPVIEATLGYQHYELDGPPRTLEYKKAESYPLAAAELSLLPFPHRVHLEGVFENPEDYDADVSYAYGSTLLFRGVVSAVPHNLDEYVLEDLGESARYSVEDLTGESSPAVSSTISHLLLRLKAPSYPAHLYVNGWMVFREGTRNRRFLGGSGFFDDLARVQVDHDILESTLDVTTGANAHFGPVEIDYAHGEWRYDRHHDLLTHRFADDTPAARGLFPVLRQSNTHGRSDRLRLHTSSTGRLVGAARLERSTQTNEHSDVNGTAWLADASVSWISSPRLIMSASYRARDVGWSTPDSVSVRDFETNNLLELPIARTPVDSTSHQVIFRLKYRATRNVAVKLEGRYDNHQRHNAGQWRLPSRTVTGSGTASVRAKPHRTLQLELGYSRQQIDEPAYNTQPDVRDQLTASGRFTPTAGTTLHARYELSSGRRDELRFATGDEELLQTGERDTLRHHLVAGLTWAIAGNVSLNGMYYFSSFRDDQTLLYEDLLAEVPALITDQGATYREEVHVGSGEIRTTWAERLVIGARGLVSKSRGSFRPAATLAREPFSLGAFSNLDVIETRGDLFFEVGVAQGWLLEALGRTVSIDFEDHRNSAVSEGTAYVLAASLTKKW